jgi:uncharacterized membrane protein
MIRINTRSQSLYLILLIASSAISLYIVISNFGSGIYTTNQDSIAIPLITTIVISTTLLFSFLIQLPLYKRLKRAKPATIFFTTLSLLSTAISSTLLFESMYYWLIPNHLTISALYLITLSVYLTDQVKLYKMLALRKKPFTPSGGITN